MHALEVIGYRHPDIQVRLVAHGMYKEMVHNMHLSIEHFADMEHRLSEDRIKSGTVVS